MKHCSVVPVLLLALLLPLAGSAPATAKDVPDLGAQIRELVRPYFAAQVLVGASIGVVKDGKREFQGYGDHVVGLPHAPDRDTLFEIGSITKVFTGILLADLVREGKVRLDQPVQELLPEGVTMPKRGEKDVTLLHLATHTSGLPRMPSNFDPADKKNPYADYDGDRMYAWLNEGELEREPGVKSVYSNLGVGLLGHLLARVEATTYEALLKKRILVPLGMTSTTITLGGDHKRKLAHGHTADLEPTANWDLDALAGAGAIRSSANDMLGFVEANLATDGPLRESLDFAMKIRHTPEGGGPSVGLGWHAGTDGKGRWHNGQTGGYHAFLALDREKKIGVVVLSNTAVMKVDQLGQSIAKLLAGEKVEVPSLREEVVIDPAVLDDYPGTYRLAPTFAITITREKSRLHLQATGQPRVVLYAGGDDVFFLRVVKAEVHFVRDEEGKVTSLVLHQNGREMPGKREPR